MSAKMDIAGEGTQTHYSAKKNLSKRARKETLTVLNKDCPHCNHHKSFSGNPAGQHIQKCCKCKKRQNAD